MLHEGWYMNATDAAEEMEEVQHDIRKREDEVSVWSWPMFDGLSLKSRSFITWINLYNLETESNASTDWMPINYTM